MKQSQVARKQQLESKKHQLLEIIRTIGTENKSSPANNQAEYTQLQELLALEIENGTYQHSFSTHDENDEKLASILRQMARDFPRVYIPTTHLFALFYDQVEVPKARTLKDQKDPEVKALKKARNSVKNNIFSVSMNEGLLYNRRFNGYRVTIDATDYAQNYYSRKQNKAALSLTSARQALSRCSKDQVKEEKLRESLEKAEDTLKYLSSIFLLGSGKKSNNETL